MPLPTSIFAALLAFTATISHASPASQVYVVHMDPTKVAHLDQSMGGTKRWYEFVIDSIADLSSHKEAEDKENEAPQLIYTYETALSAFSAKLSPKQVESLQNIDGVLQAIPDEMLSLHTTHSPQFLGLRPGKGLWSSPTLASDTIIGVIDTGIWPEHVSFRDTNLPPIPSRWRGICEEGIAFSPANCNKKVIGARSFFKGYEAVAGRINATDEYRSPRDSQGHGTHTASTAAGEIIRGASMFGVAKGSAGGMSFAARIAAYKVCWPAGCASSDILAAIDQAVDDGVDVLSLSLGGGSRPYYADNLAIAAFGAVQKGVFVSSSAGNSGPAVSTVANTAPWLMTVAASSLDRSFPATVKLGDERAFRGVSLYSGKQTKQLQLVYGDTAGKPGAEYCTGESLSPTLVKGKIVVCDRGMNGRAEKGAQVKAAGGAGMLLLNTPGQGEETVADAHLLPATALGAIAGSSIRDYVTRTRKPTAKIIFEGTFYDGPAPTMAAFSSRGPNSISPEVIKPDVTAPGVNILAAWPPVVSPTQLRSDKRRVSFNIVSGTSMSCPHVSGLAGLLKSVHRKWSPAAIKSALMTTAYTLNNKNAAIGDAGSPAGAATPFAYGSGHVDPERASNPGLIYDITTEDYLNYFCSLNYSSAQIAIFAGRSYSCAGNGKLQPGDLNYPSFALSLKGNSSTFTHTRTVTNVGARRARYVARTREPKGVSVTVEPKVLVFKKVGEKMSYTVRFVAVFGKSSVSKNTFGEIVWASGRYKVRSPIVVSWQ